MLPEYLVGKGAAGVGFQVFFKAYSFGPVLERNVGNQLPGFELGCVR